MRIAVSQRVETITSYNESRDCLDQMWTSFLSAFGATILPIPNTLKNVGDWLTSFNVDGIILSGGNDLSHLAAGKNISLARDNTEINVLKWASDNLIPVIGVCRGMQMIFHYCKGTLTSIDNHVATRHKLIVSSNNHKLSQLIPAEVNSFHDWGIVNDNMPECLKPIAFSDRNHVEAYEHTSLPWLGIMWHPEREKQWCDKDVALFKQHFVNLKDK